MFTFWRRTSALAVIVCSSGSARDRQRRGTPTALRGHLGRTPSRLTLSRKSTLPLVKARIPQPRMQQPRPQQPPMRPHLMRIIIMDATLLLT